MKGSQALVVLAVVAIASAVGAGERTIEMKDLPPPVRDAVQRERMDATLKGLAIETKDGKTFYEAETEADGRSRDLLFDATGTLLEVEEEASVDTAPAAVKAALEKRGKVVKLERVTRGARVTYDAVVKKSGKRAEVTLDANGGLVTE